MLLPGATTSTSRKLPFEPQLLLLENEATVSSSNVVVPLVSEAPTAITNGSVAGFVSEPRGAKPALPAAVTTTIPLFQATSQAYASGSIPAAWLEFVPYERLRTRMLRPLS